VIEIEKQQSLAGAEVERFWSVTQLLKDALGVSNGLVNWNCEQAAIISLDKRATIDAMLVDSGREKTIDWIVKERWNATERHKARGTNVHRWAEAVALGVEPPALEPHEEPYGEQLLRWYRKWKPEFVMAEAPVFNTTRRYAGTCDGIMRLTSPQTGATHAFLFDYKTTEHGPDSGKRRPPFSEAPLQVCAYANAERVGVAPDRDEDHYKRRYYNYDPTAEYVEMPKVDGALCVVVSPHDCNAFLLSIGEKTWRAWLHVLAMAEWQQSLWKRSIGSMLGADE